MNCFQIIIFVTSETTLLKCIMPYNALWIAFKLLSLWRQKQPYTYERVRLDCCELLSNFYLCVVRHNIILYSIIQITVVNCFQIFIFVSSDTTYFNLLMIISMLWIAFKFLSLCRQTQLKCLKNGKFSSCELLSNFYLCVVRHNSFTLSVLSAVLWIAFKFLSLCRQTQPRRTQFSNGVRVVNCFQIFIFVSSDTTIFVFKIKFLCCELLSNFYLCVVRHNPGLDFNKCWFVVNCFQIFIFVSSDTTASNKMLKGDQVVNCFQIFIFVSSDTT